MKYFLKTFGCQMNVHDSEKIAGIFSGSGYEQTPDVKDADVIVFNTCNIRQKAEHKFYSALGRLEKVKLENPHLKIAVAGCIAQQKGNALFKRFRYLDFVFGPGNIDSLSNWLNNGLQFTAFDPNSGRGGHSSHFTALEDNLEYHLKTLPLKREGRVRAWVSIMYGCDNFCAYCVVPYTRGRERSRPVRDIFNEVHALAEEGFKEITLLGQNVNSYGKNLPETIDFPDLLDTLYRIDRIERIRFVTSHPKDLSEKLINTMRDLPKICEHLHLPVQAGSDRILSLMNRRYTYREYKEKIDILRSTIPDIAITTDIIVGFPGETNEEFESTVKALEEIEFDGMFAFKFSTREGTKACEMKNQVPEDIKVERLKTILKVQEEITYRKNKMLEGRIFEVLVEGPSDTDSDKLTGRTRSNKIVNFFGGPQNTGSPVIVKILEAKQHSLLGEMADSTTKKEA